MCSHSKSHSVTCWTSYWVPLYSKIHTKPFLTNFPSAAGVTDADWTQWLNKQLCYLKKYTVFASKMFGVIPRIRKKKSSQQREGTTLKRLHSYFYSAHKSLSTLALINWSFSNPPEFLWESRIKHDYNIRSQQEGIHFKMLSGDYGV